jgi:hypothetical protein
VVSVEQVASDPPAAQGGTIEDGTYWMTAATVYTGPGGPTGETGTMQTTILVSGGTIQVVTTRGPATRTVSITTSGTYFTVTDSCPDTAVVQGSFTASGSTLTIELPAGTDDAGARTLVETFAKR